MLPYFFLFKYFCGDECCRRRFCRGTRNNRVNARDNGKDSAGAKESSTRVLLVLFWKKGKVLWNASKEKCNSRRNRLQQILCPSWPQQRKNRLPFRWFTVFHFFIFRSLSFHSFSFLILTNIFLLFRLFITCSLCTYYFFDIFSIFITNISLFIDLFVYQCNKSSTVLKTDLEAHLKRCPGLKKKKKFEEQPFIKKGANGGSADEIKQFLPEHPIDSKPPLIDRVKAAGERFKSLFDLQVEQLQSEAVENYMKTGSIKHTPQLSSIVAHISRSCLPTDSNEVPCIVEFGAGKAKLSQALAVHLNGKGHFVLLDRAHFHHKVWEKIWCWSFNEKTSFNFPVLFFVLRHSPFFYWHVINHKS